MSPSPAFSLSSMESFPLSQVSSLHQVAKVLELQHQFFQWIFRTEYFRIDYFDFLAIRGTLKSLPQHHSSKPSILWCSAFFMVQLSHPYMTTGKTVALPLLVMSLLFNMLSRFVINFLPRSKHLLISRLQSPSAVILEPKKTKAVTVSIVSTYVWYIYIDISLTFLHLQNRMFNCVSIHYLTLDLSLLTRFLKI